MARISVWYVRAALVHFGVGATIGAWGGGPVVRIAGRTCELLAGGLLAWGLLPRLRALPRR